MATKPVALHPEGVDRNNVSQALWKQRVKSPSTRRAWIEMNDLEVALLGIESPSTRRAWIEIPATGSRRGVVCVALHPEGVDRNTRVLIFE